MTLDRWSRILGVTDTKEPSKMPPDEKHPISENEAPKVDDLQHLVERAKAVWLTPLQTMFQSYAKQGRVILGGILASLENEESSKKKKE